MAKKYDKEAVLSAWKTGQYTQRQLSKRFGISTGTAAALTKGIAKENEQLVHKKIEVIQQSTAISEQDLSEVEQAVQFKLSLLKDVEHFSHKAMKIADKLLSDEETGQGFKAIVEGVDKLTVMNKINPRFANATSIEVNNTAQAAAAAVVVPVDPVEAARVYQDLMR